MKNKKHVVEYFVLAFVFIGVLVGIVGAYLDRLWFEEVYTAEDGLIENLTLLPLLAIGVVGLSYLRNLWSSRSTLFKIMISVSILFAVFVIGEEISWGQRIFDVKSPEFFLENNAQEETNLHNLVVGGKKINKIVFSQLLVVCVAFYLIVVPLVYRKNIKWRRFADHAGIPMPRLYQIVACFALFACIALIPSGKNAEILEFGITYLFFLIYVFPENAYVFRVGKQLDR